MENIEEPHEKKVRAETEERDAAVAALQAKIRRKAIEKKMRADITLLSKR
jgi:hypothetical protein